MNSQGIGQPLRSLKIAPGATVLDIGCGSGRDLDFAARAVGVEGHVFGLDIDEKALGYAEQSLAAESLCNVILLNADARLIPLPENSVDIVTSNCVFNYIEDKLTVYQEIYRVLKPTGFLVAHDIAKRDGERFLSAVALSAVAARDDDAAAADCYNDASDKAPLSDCTAAVAADATDAAVAAVAAVAAETACDAELIARYQIGSHLVTASEHAMLLAVSGFKAVEVLPQQSLAASSTLITLHIQAWKTSDQQQI